MAGTYGSNQDSNQIVLSEIPGKSFYFVVDADTGDATIYERRGKPPFNLGLNDIKMGTMKKDGTFEPHEGTALGGLFPDGYSDVLNDDQKKIFQSEAVQKKLKQRINNTVVQGNKAAGVDDDTAKVRANQLLDPDRTKAIIPPDASSEEALAQASQDAIDGINKSNQTLRDSVNEKAGTKKGAGSFGDYSYPVDRNRQQDFMKFTLLEYKAKKVGSGGNAGGFGFGARTRVKTGPDGQKSDRTILGTVSLPIPGGIKDENGVDWQGKVMDELQIQGSALARAMLGQGEQDPSQAAKAIVGRVAGNREDVKKAFGEALAGKAVGVEDLMTRSTGMIFNPNLELLFDKPTLRGFQFSFDLSPRSKDEADEIIEIIKFFKQGMAPIRSESNLFLLSPHVFQVHYILNGDGTKDHPYIGKMKECAMTNFSVDYTPQQNYSTLKDGYMTAYRISMQLKELEPVFNDDYGTGKTIEIGY